MGGIEASSVYVLFKQDRVNGMLEYRFVLWASLVQHGKFKGLKQIQNIIPYIYWPHPGAQQSATYGRRSVLVLVEKPSTTQSSSIQQGCSRGSCVILRLQ